MKFIKFIWIVLINLNQSCCWKVWRIVHSDSKQCFFFQNNAKIAGLNLNTLFLKFNTRSFFDGVHSGVLVAFYGLTDRLIVFEALKHNYSFSSYNFSIKGIYTKLIDIHLFFDCVIFRLVAVFTEFTHADRPQPFL